MGTWGMRIYEDDAALDLRGDFLDRLRSGESVADIENTLLDEYLEDDPGEDQKTYLALACVELETGTLTDTIKQKALEEITAGPDEDLWGDNIGARKREHTLIKKYLLSYDGKPVKRKSWVVLQRVDKDFVSANQNSNEPSIDSEIEDIKLDDATWQSLDNEYDDLPDDEYLAICAAHIDCLVYWLITRDYFDDSRDPLTKDLQKVKSGKMSVFDFMNSNMDLKLFAHDIRPSVRDFVVAYHSFDASSHPIYIDDYNEIMLANGRKVLSYVPAQAERDKVASKIDERLAEYKKSPYKKADTVKRGQIRIDAQILAVRIVIALVYLLFLYGLFLIFKWIYELIY